MKREYKNILILMIIAAFGLTGCRKESTVKETSMLIQPVTQSIIVQNEAVNEKNAEEKTIDTGNEKLFDGSEGFVK